MSQDWRKPITGVNFGGWLSQSDLSRRRLETFITQGDFHFVQERGFNTVRLPFNAQLIQASDGGLDADGLAWLDKAWAWAKGAQVRLILDLHEIEGHSFVAMAQNDLYTNPLRRGSARKLWLALSKHYLGQDENLVMELLNEAVAPSAAHWQDVAEDLTAAIRSVDRDRPLVVGSNLWNCAGEFSSLKPTGDPRTVYTFHFYEPTHFTHQGAPWVPWACALPLPQSYPGAARGLERVLGQGDPQAEAQAGHLRGVWDAARLESMMAPVIAFREKHKVPIFCGEFGVYLKAPRADQLRWMGDFTGLLVKHGFGFTYWNYRDLDFGIFYGDAKWAHLAQYDNVDKKDGALMDLLALRASQLGALEN